MAYYLNLFSPETYEAFSNSDRDISGFRSRQELIAKRIKEGDKLICYITKLSRFIGILEVKSEYYIDNTPIFHKSQDPFIVRFKVKTTIWLPKELAIPIKEPNIWTNLTFTKEHNINSTSWTGKIRNSLNQLAESDGKFLEYVLLEQQKKKNYIT